MLLLPIRFVLPLPDQVCVAAAGSDLRCCCRIMFVLPPASALFLVIRSHSRTCRCYLHVSVSVWSQVFVCSGSQVSVSTLHQVSVSAWYQVCVTAAGSRSSCPPPRASRSNFKKLNKISRRKKNQMKNQSPFFKIE
ncbi:hypothetical protein [Methanimicrococcus hongohii]|uniref:hypothetical protein n=1 Tax=Methanimicrococcus hongohii TaxID=3028295 RepID=UPI002931EADE|nr:hypothetical protein [Methanimicrococcus sp. Hf6]